MAELTIDFLGHQGDGVAHEQGKAVYVPFTLKGETVLADGNGTHRDLVEIKEKSDNRIEPVCKYFGTCGGCQLQHANQETYLEWKTALVTEPLSRAGIVLEADPILTFEDASRRKCVFNAQRTVDGLVLGFVENTSIRILSIDRCPVLVPEINSAMGAIRDLAISIPFSKSPARISVLSTGNGLDISIENARDPSDAERHVLVRKAIANRFSRLTVNNEILIKTAEPHIGIGKTLVAPPPSAFVQAVKKAEDAMSEIVTAHLKDCKHVADLFCGIGTFALKLAENSSVHAVEESGAALQALDEAWRKTGGALKQIKTEKRNLERRPVTFGELKKTDGLVFDPPRAGAELQTRQIAKSRVKKVAAVSCNPATLATDLEILAGGGFKIKHIIPVDQFKYTSHVEVVVLLER